MEAKQLGYRPQGTRVDVLLYLTEAFRCGRLIKRSHSLLPSSATCRSRREWARLRGGPSPRSSEVTGNTSRRYLTGISIANVMNRKLPLSVSVGRELRTLSGVSVGQYTMAQHILAERACLSVSLLPQVIFVACKRDLYKGRVCGYRARKCSL